MPLHVMEQPPRLFCDVNIHASNRQIWYRHPNSEAGNDEIQNVQSESLVNMAFYFVDTRSQMTSLYFLSGWSKHRTEKKQCTCLCFQIILLIKNSVTSIYLVLIIKPCRYVNVTLSPLVLQWGLRYGPIQRNGAA
jgi:hypothetical protein